MFKETEAIITYKLYNLYLYSNKKAYEVHNMCYFVNLAVIY